MNPYMILGGLSLGASAGATLFGPSLDDLNDRNTRRNQELIDARLREIMQLFQSRPELFREQMQKIAPMLAFGDTQGRQAAGIGARAAQAQLRRRLGSGGGIFAAALEAGANTVAADRQNTLRALATSEAFSAADREIATRSNILSGLPFAFFGPSTGGKSGQIANMFAQLGTGFGGLAEFSKKRPASAPAPKPAGTPYGPFDPYYDPNTGS